jgi:hypothetical protein
MTDTLVCWRVADMDGCPPVQSAVMDCAWCGKGIWVAQSSPSGSNIERVCIQCIATELKIVRAEDVRVQPLTRAQLDDILDYIRRRAVNG